MISLTEYANSFKLGAPAPKFNTTAISSTTPVNNLNQPKKDEFLEIEKIGREDTQKKNSVKIAIGIAVIIALIAAIIKRKSIASFFTNLFDKFSKKNPPRADNPKVGTPPISKIPPQEPQSPQTPAFIPTIETSSLEKNGNPKSDVIRKQPEAPAKIELLKPTFKENPTDKEKRAYINLVTPHLKDSNHKNIAWAIQEIEKYGTHEDLEYIKKFIQHKGDNDLLLQLVKTSNKIGTPDSKDGAWMVDYIHDKKDSVPQETYIEMFKGISKFGNGHGTFAGLLEFVDKVPDTKTEEYTDSLISALVKVGDSENVNDIETYINNTKNIPDIVMKTLEKIKDLISRKQP